MNNKCREKKTQVYLDNVLKLYDWYLANEKYTEVSTWLK